MKTAGSILKKVREEKGFTFADVERATRIRKNYLEALENSDYKNLPAYVYVKGFLKTYAEFLGLSVDYLLAFLRREYDEKKAARSLPQKPPQPLQRSRLTITPNLVIVTFGICAVVFFLAYLFYQYYSFAQLPLLILEKPQDREQLKNPFVEVVGRTDPEARVFINGQEITVSEGGVFAINVDLIFGENTIEITSVSKLGREKKEKRTLYVVKEEAETTPEETPATEVKVYQGVEVEISVGPNAAWLKIEEDNIPSYEGILSAGTKRVFNAQNTIKVRSGNAGSTTVLLNGVDQGRMGQEGMPVEKEYTIP